VVTRDGRGNVIGAPAALGGATGAGPSATMKSTYTRRPTTRTALGTALFIVTPRRRDVLFACSGAFVDRDFLHQLQSRWGVQDLSLQWQRDRPGLHHQESRRDLLRGNGPRFIRQLDDERHLTGRRHHRNAHHRGIGGEAVRCLQQHARNHRSAGTLHGSSVPASSRTTFV
jgi:hypothetical protein